MKKQNSSILVLSLIICFAITLGIPNYAWAQEDSTTTEKSKPKPKIKPYKEVIKGDVETHKGLFIIHKIDDKYFFEIPNSLLGKEMLMVTRLSKTPRGLKNGGEQISEVVLKWERVDDKIFTRVMSYNNTVTQDSSMHESVLNSNVAPIFADFSVLAENKETNSFVIDVTSFAKGDDLGFETASHMKKMYQIGSIDLGKSYINRIVSYPENVEINTTKTYKAPNTLPASEGVGRVTLEVNNSIVLLPDNPMMPRLEDRRIGYFAQQQTDYGLNQQGIAKTSYIKRWRLEPKDANAYFAGKLSEPKKPIVFYIDPATPAKWVESIKKGVEDWNVAFEAAGFKNAILAKDAPTWEEDSTWSVNDTRYSVIRYFASETENAYGPHVADPRTGEIISSHIGWYHNVMSLIRNWYFLQTAAINPKARPRELDDEVMGELIRYIAAHEVGHTLGLPHNFKSSSAYSVDSLRSKTFTDKYGTTPSIMDYARFNYIAQPEDGVTNFMPKIGPYDKYSIDWGYRLFQNVSTPQDELLKLNKMIVDKSDDPVYFYSKQLGMFHREDDPRAQTEDLGDDAVKASEYGIKNLKVLVDNLHDWSYKEGDNYDFFQNRYDRIYNQWQVYVRHVQNNISGIFEDHKSMDQKGVVYASVPSEKQVEAIQFLNREVFTTPKWLLNPSVVDIFEGNKNFEKITRAQNSSLNRILHLNNFTRINEWSLRNKDSFTIPELLTVLSEELFDANVELDSYRKILQRTYVSYLQAYTLATLGDEAFEDERKELGLTRTFPKQTDYPIFADQALNDLKSIIKNARRASGKENRDHFDNLLERLK